MTGADRLEAAIRHPKEGRAVALMPYLTSGWPTPDGFADLLDRVAAVADAIEVGVPFSDPMADGVTIQATSREALDQGVTLPWILETLASRERPCALVLMSYLNPLLSYGLERLVRDAAEARVSAFIVPDLPLDEAAELQQLAENAGLGLVQLVTPITRPARLTALCAATRGFAYAVTVTGTTGTQAQADTLLPYLDRVRAACPRPVCAGFGIATRDDVARLVGHADGAIVGSALLRAMQQGTDPVAFLRGLEVQIG